MEAFNVKGTYHKEKHCAEINSEHAVKAEQLKQGFSTMCNCNEVMLTLERLERYRKYV